MAYLILINGKKPLEVWSKRRQAQARVEELRQDKRLTRKNPLIKEEGYLTIETVNSMLYKKISLCG